MHFEARRISAEDCVPLRSLVLRPGLGLSVCRFPEDEKSVHFGAFQGSSLVSIVSAHPESRFEVAGAWRIRGMATSPEVQSKGAGGVVLRALLEWGKAEGLPLFWCNARERAILFYVSHGFTVESDLFEMPGVGPHKVMKRVP